MSGCVLCGHTNDLRYHAGQLYCKRCYQALPRSRCKARCRDGYRCRRSAVMADLCAEHARRGSTALNWTRCPECRKEYVEGEEHHCQSYPIEKVWEAKQKAVELRGLLQRLPPHHADDVRRLLLANGRCLVCLQEVSHDDTDHHHL